MVSVSALIALADWLEMKKKSTQEEAVCLMENQIERQAAVKKRRKSRNTYSESMDRSRAKNSGRSTSSVQPHSRTEVSLAPRRGGGQKK